MTLNLIWKQSALNLLTVRHQATNPVFPNNVHMLKPLGDHIIVKASSKEEKTKSGIFLPDTSKEKPEQGEIIAVGPGKILENGLRALMSVKVGDKVLFTKYSPNEINIDGNEYLVLTESDVLAIIE